MPGSYEIRFLPEERTVEYDGSDGLHYQWPDGTRLDMETAPAWCLRCDRLTEGEQVEPLEEIDRRLADLQDPTSMAYKMFRRVGRHLLDELTRRRRWREARVAAARCVVCGSTEILVLRHNEAVAHPTRPFTIEARCVGLSRVSRTDWSFTPEGVRIARGPR